MHPRQTQIDLQAVHHMRDRMVTELGRIIYGSEGVVLMLLTALLTPRNSHVLLEDFPGVGKTTLLNAFAQSLDLKFSRIQGQPGQTPADIVGYYRPNPLSTPPEMTFFAGPVFGNIVLLDELNRITPRALSAVLEAMEEEQVTADGYSHLMPKPYLVVASQNAIELDEATFPLPLSVLDRFGMRLRVGYPSRQDAMRMLAHRRAPLAHDRNQRPLPLVTQSVVSGDEVRQMRADLASLPIAAGTVEYVEELVEASRHTEGVRVGLSPRASLVLLEHAIAHAALQARSNGPLLVEPKDVAAVWTAVASHRLQINEADPYVAELQQRAPEYADTSGAASTQELLAQAILNNSGPPESWVQRRNRSA